MARKFDVPGAPDAELRRSPAAAAVGRMAAASQLRMTHFEYRVAGQPPEDWIPTGRDDLLAEPQWQRGVLQEQKYQSFRNDLMIGSFHPNHRAKWTAHELCHALVGFAWREDGSPFFHATAARLAELLPVALYYFFDEAGLQRCEEHSGFGPLFATHCAACERAALQASTLTLDPTDRFVREGTAFVERELAAIQRGRRLGRPVASPWGNLDLCSDGLAYAAAHLARLQSPEYREFMALAYPADTGCHRSLDALEERLLAVMAGLTGAADAAPWPVSRDLLQARDVAWRLFALSASCDAEVAKRLQLIAAELLASPAAMAQALDAYRACHQTYVLPAAEDLFAVGYPLVDGLGMSVRQISLGLESACPLTWEQLGDEGAAIAANFTTADVWERRPLGQRFATWLQAQQHPLAELAGFEAAVNHAPARHAVSWYLSQSTDVGSRDRDEKAQVAWDISPAVTILSPSSALLTTLQIDVADPAEAALLVIMRDETNEPQVLLPDTDAAEILRAAQGGQRPQVAPDVLESLFEQRILVPKQWRL